MAQRKKNKNKLWIALLTVIILGGGSFFYIYSKNTAENDTTDPYVIAERGTVVEKALATGTIEPDNEIEVKSKISGVVSNIYAEPGDYVRKGEPLNEVSPDSTPLMSLANMETLLFKRTVDEIDVGKVEEGLPVEIKIGALPGVTVLGEVSRISLKATQKDNATVFPVEIAITDANGAVLRAGYSANADIIIERLENVITIPERVVTMLDGRATIEVPGMEPGSRLEKEVELGLSDAITVAVRDGLDEGDKVLERKSRTLTIR